MPLAADRVTGKLTFWLAFVSVTATSPMEIVGASSSSVMVPVPVPVAMVAFLWPESRTVKVSSSSSSVSCRRFTENVFEVSPGAKVMAVEDLAV